MGAINIPTNIPQRPHDISMNIPMKSPHILDDPPYQKGATVYQEALHET